MLTKGTNYDELIHDKKRVQFLQETVPGYKFLMRKLLRKKKSQVTFIRSETKMTLDEIEALTENDQETDISCHNDFQDARSHLSEKTSHLSEDWMSYILNDGEENQFNLKNSATLIFEENLNLNLSLGKACYTSRNDEACITKESRIVEVEYDPESNDLVFVVEKLDDSQNRVISRINRLQLMKVDPLSVLLFYENNLDIAKHFKLKHFAC